MEFSSPGSFQPVEDMVGGGVFHLKPGQWTDDTSMALCLAESLVEKNDVDPIDQLERYTRWWREGHISSTRRCFGVGRTVMDALDRLERMRRPYCCFTRPNSAGNGSIMLLAPVPLFFSSDATKAIELSEDSSRMTH